MNGEGRKPERARVRRLLVRWGNVNRICDQVNREVEAYAQMKYRLGVFSDECEGDKAKKVLKELDETIGQLMENCERELKFSRAFARRLLAISGGQRRILWLRYCEKKSYVQIAAKLHKSVDHIKRQEGQAVDRLAEVLWPKG